MLVAALYDVHGNLAALEAVLAEPRCAAADVVVSGGDLVAGAQPAECLDLLTSLGDRVRFLRGNGDRNVLSRGQHFGGAWAANALGAGRLEQMVEWPLLLDLEVYGGTTFCHATPHADDELVTRLSPTDELEAAFADDARDLVVVGHTHMQVDLALPSGRRIVNAGSVGRPYEGRRGAFWTLIGDENGVEPMRTDYDVERAAATIRASGHPDAEEHATQLLEPPDPAEVAAYFESLRGA